MLLEISERLVVLRLMYHLMLLHCWMAKIVPDRQLGRSPLYCILLEVTERQSLLRWVYDLLPRWTAITLADTQLGGGPLYWMLLEVTE